MIGKKIRSLRRSRHMSLKELASIIELNPNTLSLYERDRIIPRLDTVKKIADYFKVDINFLLENSETKKRICHCCNKNDDILVQKPINIIYGHVKVNYYAKYVKDAICLTCLMQGIKLMGGNSEKELLR